MRHENVFAMFFLSVMSAGCSDGGDQPFDASNPETLRDWVAKYHNIEAGHIRFDHGVLSLDVPGTADIDRIFDAGQRTHRLLAGFKKAANVLSLTLATR